MPIGARESYFLRGESPERSAMSLEESLRLLLELWFGKPNLRRLTMGNVSILLELGGRKFAFEITDADLIDRYMGSGGPLAIIEQIAKDMGLTLAEAEQALEGAAATSRVDSIQDPAAKDAWKPGETLTPSGKIVGAEASETFWKRETAGFIGAALREEDIERARGVRRRRVGRSAELLRILARQVSEGKIPLRDASSRSGVPVSTLRDAADRAGRPPIVKVGKAYSEGQVDLARRALKEAKGNAAEAARRTGIPERTLREMRAREKASHVTPKLGSAATPGGPRRYTQKDQEKVLARVRKGEAPSVVARSLGIPPRTAREWVQKKREGR